MSVFYKFKSALTYDTIQFDDLHISLPDFKKAVIQQKQLGKNTNFDLQVTNAETDEVYSEDSLIPKNSSLIVVRIPLAGAQKKPWDIGDQLSSRIGVLSSDYLQENAGNIVVKSADLAAMNASEDDKIQAMMFQSTVDYDPANYLRVKGGSQFGDPPAGYLCHKCHHSGHWIKDCPITVVPDIKKSSGIPQSFMTPVEDASAPGALMTPSGTFAVPTIDLQAYKEGKKEKPFIPSEETEESLKPSIPEDLTCSLCQDLLTDAVMMPCCGNSFCDECIRNVLLESEENQCPDCKEKDTSPETLIPNRFLRNAVNNFRNKTGYKGGGQRVKRNEVERPKSPAIGMNPDNSSKLKDRDQDVEIIDTVPAESSPKLQPESEKERGSAIVVLGSRPQVPRIPQSRVQTNGASKVPTIHVEHRPPVGRPKVMQSDMNSLSKDPQRNLVGNGVRLSPDVPRDDRNKLSPGLVNPVNKYSAPPGVPNTSQLPPGYSQQTLQPMNPHFPGGGPPIMPNYGPPPNTMIVPQHITSQQPSGRIYPPYSTPPMYQAPMGGYRGVPGNHPRMRQQHHDQYSDRNVVEDPLAAFERHLRERERQDRMKRNRARRSRSRSHSRPSSRPRSRPRSRSRSPSKKRSNSKSPIMRKESPLLKRDSRTPPNIIRRSKSRSRSRTRMRSRSRSHPRNSAPRSRSRSPLMNVKKKRSISMSPPPVGFKKQSRSPSPIVKMNRSRTRSRSRSKSVTRSRKRRRTRSRSRSFSSLRSISRGRSFSKSISPRRRAAYSPGYVSRTKRRSRSPPRHVVVQTSNRHRGGHYRDGSPYQSGQFYEHGDRYKRGSRGGRYIRGYSRYAHGNQNYESGSKHDRHGNIDLRYADASHNSRGYVSNNEHAKSRKDAYYSPPTDHYNQYSSGYNEVAPPGTTDMVAPAFGGYSSSLPFSEPMSAFNERVDKYRRASPDFDRDSGTNKSNYKDASAHDEFKKTKDYDREKDHDHHRRKSRERHGHHHYSEHEKTSKRPSSRTRYPSLSPSSRDKKHRSGRSRDKENKPRADRASSNKRDSHDRLVEYDNRGDRSVDVRESRSEVTPDHEKSKKEVADKKEEYRDKKDKSKRKKRKESDVEKKKKKKPKVVKKDEDAKCDSRKMEKKVDDQLDDVASDESKPQEFEINDELYGGIEGTKVDTTIIESYGKIAKFDEDSQEKASSKSDDVILAAVPELSKWERDEVSSPSDERGHASNASEFDDKRIVTTEILKRAENVLFQKGSTKSTSRSVETKNESVVVKEKEDLQLIENAREARKSGNSIQVTVPAVISKSEDESRPTGRISAKDRLGAKVEDRNYATVRSLVEPKVKPRSTVKAVVEVKHPKVESSRHEKHEKRDRHDKSEKHDKSDKHDEKKKKESSRHGEAKRSKHREKEKSKRSRKSSEEDTKPKKEAAKDIEVVRDESPIEEPTREREDQLNSAPEKLQESTETKSTNEVKAILDKKRPIIDEANFEPDYDLTSESEGEIVEKGEIVEPPKKPEIVQDLTKETKQTEDKVKVQKVPVELLDDISSTESSSESSSDSSVERKKRKKRKAKKRKKAKKRRASTSDSDSDDSSDSDSESDSKQKHKKKHRHKTKKSRSAKKKKKSKHK